MKEIKIGAISAIENTNKKTGAGPQFLTEQATAAAHRLHRGLPGYAPTPLVKLNDLAARLGLGALLVKDESKRFGLNAFKGLGGLYAVAMALGKELGLHADTLQFADLQKPGLRAALKNKVFVTATDGNHGRGVSWAAGQLGCEAYVYMPVGSSEQRAAAIRSVNPKAHVQIMQTGYDDTVRYAAAQAEKNGWTLIQDTSWPGYEEVPGWIVQGYTTLLQEACGQMDALGVKPTHVLVQAGVGAMAGSAVGYLANRYAGCRPQFIVAEPESMACIYESARRGDGCPHEAADQGPTIMAGLNCGEPCTLTWPILRDFADWYVKCPDAAAAYGMRLLAAPCGSDAKVVSGESGAVTTGLLALLAGKPEYAPLKRAMGLGRDSVVLCISTEGDTDPEKYRRIVYEGEYPLV